MSNEREYNSKKNVQTRLQCLEKRGASWARAPLKESIRWPMNNSSYGRIRIRFTHLESTSTYSTHCRYVRITNKRHIRNAKIYLFEDRVRGKTGKGHSICIVCSSQLVIIDASIKKKNNKREKKTLCIYSSMKVIA